MTAKQSFYSHFNPFRSRPRAKHAVVDYGIQTAAENRGLPQRLRAVTPEKRSNGFSGYLMKQLSKGCLQLPFPAILC